MTSSSKHTILATSIEPSTDHDIQPTSLDHKHSPTWFSEYSLPLFPSHRISLKSHTDPLRQSRRSARRRTHVHIRLLARPTNGTRRPLRLASSLPAPPTHHAPLRPNRLRPRQQRRRRPSRSTASLPLWLQADDVLPEAE